MGILPSPEESDGNESGDFNGNWVGYYFAFYIILPAVGSQVTLLF